ncbi:MAG: hypothetical protein L0G48_08130 [Staphylococcus equorum]|nr:hypothetical protein [Acinetobacter sp.]MDN5638099.1 hypothetical protein [Staphylococcus equorum]
MKNQDGAIEINISLVLGALFCLAMVGSLVMSAKEARPIESSKSNVVLEQVDQLKNTAFEKTYTNLLVTYQSNGNLSEAEYKILTRVFNGYMIARSTNSEQQFINQVDQNELKQAQKDMKIQQQVDDVLAGKNRTANYIIIAVLILMIIFVVLFVIGPY